MSRFKACVFRYHCTLSKETNLNFRVKAVHEKTEASFDNNQTLILILMFLICCAGSG